MKKIQEFLLNIKKIYKNYLHSILCYINYKHISFIILWMIFHNIIIIYCSSPIIIMYNISTYILFSYYILYTYLNLKKTILSVFCFFFQCYRVIFFLYGFIIIFYIGIPQAIYVENLSIYTQGHYLNFVSICLFIPLIYYLIENCKNSKIFKFKTYPYMQEEYRILIDALFYDYIGNSFKWINNKIISSNIFCFSYFYISFLLIYLYRFFIALLFINFSFFHGDLRIIFYWLPISFFTWVLSYFLYHHSWFIQGNINALKSLLEVKHVENIPQFTSITVLPYEYKLTEKALSKGYSELDYENLITLWHNLFFINQLFNKINDIGKLFSSILLNIYISCWFFLFSIYIFS